MITDEVEEISLEELTDLALAADPDAPIGADAVPFGTDGADDGSLLPAWYMPAPRSFARTPRRRAVALVIIGALVLLNGFGLCVTYGYVEIAW